MNRKTLAALGVLAVAATACSVNTEPDEYALVYNGSMGSATKFVKCVGPSKREDVDAGDNTWTYPAGQRTFDFTGGDKAESKPLTVVSKDNVQLAVPGVATFSLNTGCITLKKFHDTIGRKYKAFFYGTGSDTSSETGWVNMLNVYFKQPLDRALDAASQEFGWKELYNDPAAKQKWEARVGELAGQFITEAAGDQYFCAPNYVGSDSTDPKATAGKDCGQIVLTLQKPQPPDNLVEALAATEAAKAQNIAQEQVNAKVKTELESMKEVVDVLGWQGYVQLKAVESGKATVIIGGGNGVNITPSQK